MKKILILNTEVKFLLVIIFFDQSYIDKVDWFPTMRARALPGGVVTKESYESMVLQIIELTKQTLPLDGLFFDIHGAMNVEGMDDPEGDFIDRIRAVVGPKNNYINIHGFSWKCF